jgi:quinol monooxygenase YgiN
MAGTIKVIADVVALPDKAAELEQLLVGLVQNSRQEAGNIQYQLLKSSTDANQYTFIEEWESQAALGAHAATEDFKATTAKMAALLQKKPQIRVFGVVL